MFKSIASLPGTIIDGVKSIFIPDTKVIRQQFNDTMDSVQNKFGLTTDSIDNWQDTWEEKPVENIEQNYTIPGLPTMKIKFLDTKYLKNGVDFFRPIIRGFIVLLLLFYHYRQLLSFIGQDPNIMNNAEQNYKEWKGGKEK